MNKFYSLDECSLAVLYWGAVTVLTVAAGGAAVHLPYPASIFGPLFLGACIGVVAYAFRIDAYMVYLKYKKAYHEARIAELQRAIDRSCDEFRAYARSVGDHTPYTNEAIIEAFRREQRGGKSEESA